MKAQKKKERKEKLGVAVFKIQRQMKCWIVDGTSSYETMMKKWHTISHLFKASLWKVVSFHSIAMYNHGESWIFLTYGMIVVKTNDLMIFFVCWICRFSVYFIPFLYLSRRNNKQQNQQNHELIYLIPKFSIAGQRTGKQCFASCSLPSASMLPQVERFIIDRILEGHWLLWDFFWCAS
jgi:hypothetical protein